MSIRRSHAWIGLLASVSLGFAALGLITVRAEKQFQLRSEAAAEAQHQEDLRTALYRMEQRFAPLLARTLGRTEVAERASEMLSLDLSFADMTAVPFREARELPTDLEQRSLAHLGGNATGFLCEIVPPLKPNSEWSAVNGGVGLNMNQIRARGQERSQHEFIQRQEIAVLSNTNAWISPKGLGPPLETGPLVVGWGEHERELQLVLARGMRVGGQALVQGLWMDWAELERVLLAEVHDLFIGARLEPLAETEWGLEGSLEGAGARLASFPARLVVPPIQSIVGDNHGLKSTILSAWTLGLGACLVAVLALWVSQRDAARQRRFTSAVTHELRTPLTTFRMYSEMLSREMVPKERRPEYLRTLEEESRRLSALVENVLAHSRIENAPKPTRWEDLSLASAISRFEGPLRRRCEEAGTDLALNLGEAGELQVHTEPEALALILTNLVDNACKYGVPQDGHGVEAPVGLSARANRQHVILTVSDHGPGVPASSANKIFRPFERAGRDESDPATGVGLGLALARDLARSLGGGLELKPSPFGASFELRLLRA